MNVAEECEAQAKVFVEVTYEAEISRMCQQAVLADWEYNTDLGDPDKEQAATEANIAYSKSIFDHWDNVLRHYNYTDFIEESLKRQLKFLNIVGTAALNDADLTQVFPKPNSVSSVWGEIFHISLSEISYLVQHHSCHHEQGLRNREDMSFR